MRKKLQVKRELAKKYIDKKLRNRMIVFTIISLVMLGVVIYEIAIGSIKRRIELAAIVIGLWIWLLVHRMFHISRHEDEEKVISRIDRTGAIILVMYILFSIGRHRLIEQFFQWSAVLAVTMAAVFGMMAGRVIGMRNRIVKILKEQEVWR